MPAGRGSEGSYRPRLRRSRRPATALMGLLLLGASARLLGQTVTVGAIADTTIKQGSPNQSFGAQQTLVLREGGSRVLVRFDLAAIRSAVGSGSLATAQLQLYIGTNAGNWGSTGRTVDAYRIDAAWVESAATWNCADDANPANDAPDCAQQWNGGTIEGDAADTVVVTNATSGWIQFDVTADVQAFLAGTENDGWLIEKTDEGQGGRLNLVSREGMPGQGPRLVLTSESATTDTVPPSLAIVAPAQPIVVNIASPPIAVAYQDGGSGVDVSTLTILLDGHDLTAACTAGAQSASCVPPPLAAGSHTVTASVRDHAGNAASATRSFRLLIGPSVNTLTFPAVADTYITRATPDREYGRAPILRVAKLGPSRALVQVDAAALTTALAGNQLVSAQLELSIAANGNNWGASGRSVGAYRVTTAWSEAAATWDCPADSNLANHKPDCAALWSGGAFASSPTAAALITRRLAGMVDFDVTTDVAAFLGGAINDGWLLAKTDESLAGRVDFVSREANPELAAQLVVVLQVPSGDTTPPTLVITSPNQPVIYDPAPPISVTYSDSGSGVDTSTLSIALDGTALTGCTVGASSASCASPILAPGGHSLVAAIRDRAGNAATASLSFTLSVEVPSPSVALTAPADGAVVNSTSLAVTGMVTAAAALASVTVNGQAVTLQGGSFAAQVTLGAGFNLIVAQAIDSYGNVGVASARVTLDTTPPTLTIRQPAPGAMTNAASILVSGQVSDDTGVTTVDVGGAQTAVNGDGSFQAQVALTEGTNSITLEAIDLAGNKTDQSLSVIRFSLPQVAITSPADLSYLASTTVAVSGTVSDSAATVTVNGQPAAVAGGSFTASGVPLLEGGNVLTATATDANGHVNTATINVVRDLTPPTLSIAYPQDGASVSSPTVTVSGLVNDIVAGTVNASQVVVTVNGQPAAVANRSFAATVSLAPGTNTLTVKATDVSGNSSQAAITVHQQAAITQRVALVAGSGQSGVIGTPLGQPLVAALLDATGQPVAGQKLFFRVRGNDGSLDGAQRGLTVTTDATGQAAAHFTLGTRAGAGNQVVEAFAPGFAGPAVFQESAVPGSPSLIVVDSGDQQVGITGQPATRPLVAVVTDAGFNRLQGVAVQFVVAKGQGSFSNGQPTATVNTDSDGRAIVTFTLDPAEGVANNVVRATIAGLAGSPAAHFVLSGRAAGTVASTTVSGVVLDNANQPVAGVTVSIRGTLIAGQTDATGQFHLAGVPPGTPTLIVDGSTAQRPGAWPDLEYFLTVIPGRDNTVNMPIYLLPLDQAHALQVSETVGGVLTLPQVPGFALEIAPGSVTFPGGSRNGLVSVTVVHADKVPMVPNFGQQPRLIVTIQPAGARFDPPARLTLPNVDGLAAGSVTEMYSFDHDLGHFVSIGPATVSDDGTSVTSNPGVGVIKAGWHCCGNPATIGTPFECPDCQECDGVDCVPDITQDGKPCPHKFGFICRFGECFCAVPINFHEVSHSQIGSTLEFKYQYESSTGNLGDLDAEGCVIKEQVVYPIGIGTYIWPQPWQFSTPSPTVLEVPIAGFFFDDHDTGPILQPYNQASFVAQQRYIYICPCANDGNPVVMAGIWPIIRSISERNDGKFKYTITKTDGTASIDPLP
jgi:hypothetical protein